MYHTILGVFTYDPLEEKIFLLMIIGYVSYDTILFDPNNLGTRRSKTVPRVGQ